jgi:copper transport protein
MSKVRTVATGLVTALLVVAAVLMGSAGPASAHAVLSTSTPAEGERLPQAPSSVALTFTEPVSLGLGGVSVLNSDGTRVDAGQAEQPAPNRVRADVTPGLPEGTYLISYRVTSTDGHVVSGGIVFAIGDQLDTGAVAGLSAATDPWTTGFGIVARTLLFGGVLTAVGLALFLRFIHDGASDARRLVTWVRIAAALGAVGAVGQVVARAADATGRGPGVATDTGVLGEVLRQGGLGWWLVGVLLGLAVIHLGTGLGTGAVGPALVLYGCLVTVGSFALTGHVNQADGGWALGVADAVHVGVAAIWVGGIVGTLAVLRWRAHPPPDDDAESDAASDDDVRSSAGTADIVVRVSTTAALAVAVLWVTGVMQAWWTVGNWSALFDNSYGRTLLVKLGLVVATLAVAAWNRYRLVPSLLDAQDDLDAALDDTTLHVSTLHGSALPDAGLPDTGLPDTGLSDTGLSESEAAVVTATTATLSDPGADGSPPRRLPAWDRLLRTVKVEAVVLLAVVAMTAVLVETTPARTDLAGPQPFNETLPVQTGLEVNLGVVPGTVGPNELHITYVGANGQVDDSVESVAVEMTLPAQGVGPITLNGSPLGRGHYVVVTEQIAVAGTWRVEVVSRIGTFDQARTAFDVPIADGR